jgi:TetR/AcrR family transcriptional regulator, regulator of cefoperazone and chloramphenicol sensitivity
MSPDETTTREKILSATIRLLTSSDPEKLTIRQIAEQAAVNVAAVNYHFGTKESLVDEAIFSFSSRSLEMGMAALRDMGREPAQRLLSFFEGYSRGLLEHRGATMIAFMAVMNASGTEGKFAGLTRRMIEAVRENVAALGTAGGGAAVSRRTLALFSAVVFPFLYPDQFAAACGVDYRDPVERGRYIQTVIRDTVAERR